MNCLLGPLLFTERNGILFQKEYLPDRIIKSDNGMSFSQSLILLSSAYLPSSHENPRSYDLGGESLDSNSPHISIQEEIDRIMTRADQ